MSEEICLILHRKSADRPEVKEAVKAVIKSGAPLRVRIPWNKKDKHMVGQREVRWHTTVRHPNSFKAPVSLFCVFWIEEVEPLF